MKVKVVHSLALRQSAVQLFVGNEMKIVSHIVGIDTIGFEDLTNAMETEHNWRAMLIKDNLGDWAICLGEWFGMQRGISNGRHSVRGNPGFFRVTISFLRKTAGRTLFLLEDLGSPVRKVVKHLDLSDPNRPFKVGNLTCHLETGKIQIDTTKEEEPFHQVALAFTLSTLYLLVQPRPETLPITPKSGLRRVRFFLI